MNKSNKDKTVALVLCIFFGYFGVHRFYVGKIKSGILYLFTLGLFGIGWIYDIIQIATSKFTDVNGNLLLNITNNSYRPIIPDTSNTEYYTFKVAGVTFTNGRKTRQAILRKIKWHDEPFDGFINYTLEQYDFEGETAVGIYANGEQIGNVPREHLNYILSNWDRIAAVYSVTVYGGNKIDDGTSTNFGAEATISLKKQTLISPSINNLPTTNQKANSQSAAYVFISKKGKKYHKDPYCGGMKNSKRILLSDAKRKGYTRCEKCRSYFPY